MEHSWLVNTQEYVNKGIVVKFHNNKEFIIHNL
jgi:hypothetical protein